MKKKIILLLVVAVLTITMTACGSKEVKDEPKKENNTVQNEKTNIENGVNSVELVFHPATTSNYATVKVDSKIKMDDTSAWLGLVPQGKDYITELEADEVDIIWWGLEPRENDDDPYVWACDFETVDDGKYDVVIATSDDENVGYVVIQLSMEKKGDKITFDYENAKIKERPTK